MYRYLHSKVSRVVSFFCALSSILCYTWTLFDSIFVSESSPVDAPPLPVCLPSYSVLHCYFAPRHHPLVLANSSWVVFLGAVLVEYSADTGVWVFDTLHWSRYAMDDSDDDEEGGDVKAKAASGAASKLMPPPPPLGPSGRIPRAATATRGECSAVVVHSVFVGGVFSSS